MPRARRPDRWTTPVCVMRWRGTGSALMSWALTMASMASAFVLKNPTMPSRRAAPFWDQAA